MIERDDEGNAIAVSDILKITVEVIGYTETASAEIPFVTYDVRVPYETLFNTMYTDVNLAVWAAIKQFIPAYNKYLKNVIADENGD